MKITKEEYYRQRAESYPLIDNEAKIRYEKVLKWLKLDDGLVIREVGCKFAILNDLIERENKNISYTAVDIDENTLRKIPSYNSTQFICHNVNNGLPFSDKSSDYIICLEVMEHLENPSFFLSEVKRVLRPGGKLILSVPNPYCWMEWLANYRKMKDTEGHIASFTYGNIDALLSFANMILRETTGTFTRVPFTKRLIGDYFLLKTNNIFLTRSNMFLIDNTYS